MKTKDFIFIRPNKMHNNTARIAKKMRLKQKKNIVLNKLKKTLF